MLSEQSSEIRLTRQSDVVRVARDTEGFSNAVSRRIQIPNGLDGAEHAYMTRAFAPFFAEKALDALEEDLVERAAALVAELSAGGRVFDAVGELGERYAVQAQSAWLGWERDYEDTLVMWVTDYREAARGTDAAARGDVAERFDALVGGILDDRRRERRCDVTSLLMQVRKENGEHLSDEEITAILRNWTGGDLASIALCTGVVVHWLASHPASARGILAGDDVTVEAAIDEILRLDDPFVSNRRRAIHDTVVGGCPVHAGQGVILDWRAANLDPEAFGDADVFDPIGHAAANLVYGIGPHACPGRGLATRELRVLVRALADAGECAVVGIAERAPAPLAGYRSVPIRIR